jgi:uncharacterized Zn-finger protein
MNATAMSALQANTGNEHDELVLRLRNYLRGTAERAIPITYLALATALQLLPPNTIRRLTEALERLMVEDAAVGRPFIAALVISRTYGGIPAPGFFNCAARLGRSGIDATGVECCAFHAAEFKAAVAFWGGDSHHIPSIAAPMGASCRSTDGNYGKFRNDNGATEIRIGLKQFKCIGVSPPHDHPHIYLDMGDDDTILCPYCATLFRFDVRLNSREADPPDALYSEHPGGCGAVAS